MKVKKKAKIKNQYYQVPHLNQDTVWEIDNTTKCHIQESKDVSSFQAGDHKATRHRQDNMAKTHFTNIKDPQKKYHLGIVSKKLTGWLKLVSGYQTHPYF